MSSEHSHLAQNFNSSITRVRPLLRQLLTSRTEGATRLTNLFQLVPKNRHIVEDLVAKNPPEEIHPDCRRKRDYEDNKLGSIRLEGAFETSVSPPGAVLRHLIKNPHLLAKAWVRKRGGFKGETRRLRDALIDQTDSEIGRSAQRRALLELDLHGAAGSARKWWAFEGSTEVDCLIETNSFVLFIEGKRTEGISLRTDWVEGRHQLSRNLECAQQHAARKGKQYGVLLISEKGDQVDHVASTSDEVLRGGLHHLDDHHATDLLGHFLGELHWQDLKGALDLGDKEFPDSSADALEWKP